MSVAELVPFFGAIGTAVGAFLLLADLIDSL